MHLPRARSLESMRRERPGAHFPLGEADRCGGACRAAPGGLWQCSMVQISTKCKWIFVA